MKMVAICVASLIAIIAIGLALLLRHPIPNEIKNIGDLNVANHIIKAPFDIMYVDSLLDGGSMIFGIKDANSTVFAVVCEFGDRDHRFQKLQFHEGMPVFDGQTQPMLTEIIGNADIIRNVLYYTMKKNDFHGSQQESFHAQSLYPNLLTRYAR